MNAREMLNFAQKIGNYFLALSDLSSGLVHNSKHSCSVVTFKSSHLLIYPTVPMKAKQKWQSNFNYRKTRQYSRNSYCYHDVRFPCVKPEEMKSPHRNPMLNMWTGFICDEFVLLLAQTNPMKNESQGMVFGRGEFCVVFITIEVEIGSNHRGFKKKSDKANSLPPPPRW